jgi:hypothetical protein
VVRADELRVMAGDLENHADPRVRWLASAVADYFEPPPFQFISAPPPPCPGCGRRFATSLYRGRFPLHGPRHEPCPGALQPVDEVPEVDS